MSNLVESLQMCMWFDVNIISRRNLLSAVLSSLLVNISVSAITSLGWFIEFSRLCFCFSSSALGGSSSGSQRPLSRAQHPTSATTSAECSAPSPWSWSTQSRTRCWTELATRAASAPATAWKSGCSPASCSASRPSSPVCGCWSRSSPTSCTSRASASSCKTFSFSSPR